MVSSTLLLSKLHSPSLIRTAQGPADFLSSISVSLSFSLSLSLSTSSSIFYLRTLFHHAPYCVLFLTLVHHLVTPDPLSPRSLLCALSHILLPFLSHTVSLSLSLSLSLTHST